jgi:hypothetical protein
MKLVPDRQHLSLLIGSQPSEIAILSLSSNMASSSNKDHMTSYSSSKMDITNDSGKLKAKLRPKWHKKPKKLLKQKKNTNKQFRTERKKKKIKHDPILKSTINILVYLSIFEKLL